jgi:hypothetical protein
VAIEAIIPTVMTIVAGLAFLANRRRLLFIKVCYVLAPLIGVALVVAFAWNHAITLAFNVVDDFIAVELREPARLAAQAIQVRLLPAFLVAVLSVSYLFSLMALPKDRRHRPAPPK